MKTSETAPGSAAMKVGTWLFVCGVLIIGPLGFALLCGLAYAAHFSNMALAVVCLLLLSSPLVLLAVWVPLMGATYIMERSQAEEALTHETTPIA